MSKKVLVIQHSKNVPPAQVALFFEERQIPFEIFPIFNPDCHSKFPDLNTTAYSAIVSLGGNQATYEDDEYPYLKWEKTFLATQLARKTPILGLCLGAQLLADAIGGHGHLGRYGREAGYVQYELTPEGKEDPVISKVFDEQHIKPLFLMHHQDSFDLPSNATVLVYTSNKYIAAYRIGSALAIQFHPEASFTQFNGWVQSTLENHPESYKHLNINDILNQAEACESQAEQSRRLFFETWWDSIEKE